MIAIGILAVVIDNWEEPYKYILIRSDYEGEQKYYVRGNHDLEFHANNFEAFQEEISAINGFSNLDIDTEEGKISGEYNNKKIKFRCVGGGRLTHDYQKQQVFIYGYSQSYGQADHNIALKLIEQNLNYPANNLTMSNDGY